MSAPHELHYCTTQSLAQDTPYCARSTLDIMVHQTLYHPIFSTRYSVLCKIYTGYHGTSEIEHGLCACTVDNPLAKARGLSLRTGAQTMLCLSHDLNSNKMPEQQRHQGSALVFLA